MGDCENKNGPNIPVDLSDLELSQVRINIYV